MSAVDNKWSKTEEKAFRDAGLADIYQSKIKQYKELHQKGIIDEKTLDDLKTIPTNAIIFKLDMAFGKKLFQALDGNNEAKKEIELFITTQIKKYRDSLKTPVLKPSLGESVEFKQKNIGDCYLLAALKGIFLNDKATEKIMKQIEPVQTTQKVKTSNGEEIILPGLSFRVMFKNNEVIEVDQAELSNLSYAKNSCPDDGKSAKLTISTTQGEKTIGFNTTSESNLKLGQHDLVGIWEIAYMKSSFRKKQQKEQEAKCNGNSGLTGLVGGNPGEVLNALTGWQTESIHMQKEQSGNHINDWLITNWRPKASEKEYIDGSKPANRWYRHSQKNPAVPFLLDNIAANPSRYIVTAASWPLASGKDTESHKEGLIPASHAFTLKSVDAKNKTVTLINPWDTKKPFELSYEGFQFYFYDMQICYVGIPDTSR